MSATTTTTMQDTAKSLDEMDWQSRHGEMLVRDQLFVIQEGVAGLPTPRNNTHLAPIVSNFNQDSTQNNKTYKVGIIGAGCAGLFTGMIFDYLKKEKGLKVDYEILEANEEDRLGGRLYTHYFSKGAHDYYDVGAMRFPNSPMMKRVFDLFEKDLDMEKTPRKFEDREHPPKKGDLIPYYLKGPNTKELYNDVTVTAKDGTKSNAISFKVAGLPKWDAKLSPGEIINETISVFVKRLQKDPESGWEYLMNKGDAFSVRQWFLNTLDFNTAEWLETYSYGTGWYDQALSEMVLESNIFDYNPEDWWCIEGGSQEIAKRMYKKLQERQAKRVTFGKKVTKLERIPGKHHHKAPATIRINVEGEGQPRNYDAVFNSAPLGSLQRLDVRGLNLNWGTKQAIRSLGYGASCKVGISFKRMWWMEEPLNITEGGVSKTDLPIRTCVYPSYNIHDNKKKLPLKRGEAEPGVLLCSYTWSLEAQRIGTLIHKRNENETWQDKAKREKELRALLIDNLAKLHSNSEDEYNALYKIIDETYNSHYAYDWYNDPTTTGAFAYFGPGQFNNMYPYIVRSDGTHIIIGEASSSHHAWVVGALESAVRGVYQFLAKHSRHDKECAKVLEMYNRNEIPSPYGPVPDEFNRTRDVDPLNLHDGEKKPCGVGEWLRQGILAEEIRLRQGHDRLNPKEVTLEDVKDITAVIKT